MLDGILYVVAAFVALMIGLSIYLWWQSRVKPASYELMFEVRDGEPIRVSRADDGWIVTPSDGVRPTALRTGVSPDTLGAARTLTPAGGSYHVAEELRRLERYFFEVELEDGRTYQTAERVLPLESAVNFRDLGGYETTDGRRTAWGKVYRADETSRLTDDDVTIIRNLGIRTFCDLRTFGEVEHHPDRVPEGITYRHMPIFARNPIGRRHVLFGRHRLDLSFKQLYRSAIIDQGAPVLGALLKLVADPENLPLLMHCTSGKDRTGVASALLLHICRVPREMIIVDYSLTNLSAEKSLLFIRQAFSPSRPFPGLRVEQFYPLFSARPELIEHAFAHIETTYGSIDEYLHGPVGLTDEDIEAIRQNLLV